MTQAAAQPWLFYAGTGVTLSFPYPFRIGAAVDLKVYVNSTLVTAYSVTGVGVATGGNVVFAVAPADGTIILIVRATPQTQLTDYIDNDPFGAETHEAALDKLTRMLQDTGERFSRIPSLPQTTPTALRNLSFPVPGAGQLLGWNALGTALTLYDVPIGFPALLPSTVRLLSFVRLGGLHAPVAATVSLPFGTTAVTALGTEVIQASASIDYAAMGAAATDTAWVIIADSTAATLGNFTRVPGTQYYVNVGDVSQPPLPTEGVWLMRVTLTSGAIAAVTDLRRPLSEVLNGMYDVSDSLYGAIGDGVTDDTEAILTALAAAAVPGGTVMFRAGTFAYAATMVLPLGVSIVGTGSPTPAGSYLWNPTKQSTVLKWIGDPGGAMLDTADRWDRRVEHLTFDANNIAPVCWNLVHSPVGAIFRDCLIINTRNDPAELPAIYLPWIIPEIFPPGLNHFEKIKVTQIGGKAMVIAGGTAQTFLNCEMYSNFSDCVAFVPCPLPVTIEGADNNWFYGGAYGTTMAGRATIVFNYPTFRPACFQNNFWGCVFGCVAGADVIYATNNVGFNYINNCWLHFAGNPYNNGGGGMVVFNGTAVNHTPSGTPSAFQLSPPSSPWEYENTTAYVQEFHTWYGADATVRHSRNGDPFYDIGGVLGNDGTTLTVMPGDKVQITFTSVPLIVVIPR